MRIHRPFPRLRFVPALAACALVLCAIAWLMSPFAPRANPASPHKPDVSTTRQPSPPVVNDEPSVIVLHPLPVAIESGTHQWTKEDATDLKVIEKIAHNQDEAVKMLEENERIQRRQLVYRKETAAKLIQKSRLSGEPLKRFTLPALDGRELEVEVVSSDLAPSGQTGSFHGRLVGKPQSLVTLAFEFGVEAFTVISPEENLYLQADPRESGELIIKSFNPDEYVPFQCGKAESAQK